MTLLPCCCCWSAAKQPNYLGCILCQRNRRANRVDRVDLLLFCLFRGEMALAAHLWDSENELFCLLFFADSLDGPHP